MPHYHAVVWMDHAEAKVFEFAGEITERKHVRNPNDAQVHHKAGVIGPGKAEIGRAHV